MKEASIEEGSVVLFTSLNLIINLILRSVVVISMGGVAGRASYYHLMLEVK